MIADLCSTNKQESQFMSKKQTNKQFLQQDQIIIKYWRYIKENCVDEELAKAGSYILWKWSSFRRLVGKWTVLNYPLDHRYNFQPRLMNSSPDSVFKFSQREDFFWQKWTIWLWGGWALGVLYTIIYASLAMERTLHRFPVKNVYLCEYPLISDNNLLRGANTWQGMPYGWSGRGLNICQMYIVQICADTNVFYTAEHIAGWIYTVEHIMGWIFVEHILCCILLLHIIL